MAINFYLDSRINKSGDAPIRVSISVCGVRIITSSGYSINPKKWDSKKQKIRQGCSNTRGIAYNTINAHLNAIDSFFIEYENTAHRDKIKVTTDSIKSILKSNFSISKNHLSSVAPGDKTFIDCFDSFVREGGQANGWAIATFAKLRTIRGQLLNYSSTLTFDSFNESGLISYANYLRDVKNMRNTTTIKSIAYLKWFLRWATSKGYKTNPDYLTFKLKLRNADKRVIFLTWSELMKVYSFDIPKSKKYLDRVRDVFCFCCFTSLRYSDVFNLKRSDIINDTLNITTVKTSDSIRIELNKYSKAILDKYADIPYDGNKALPVTSNQRTNDYIKELGEMCEINEPQTIVYFKGNKRIEEVYPKYELLSTHAGRRTFICNALALGIPAQVVMKWTGHSDYKAMKPYIDIADNIKAEAMNKFNEM